MKKFFVLIFFLFFVLFSVSAQNDALGILNSAAEYFDKPVPAGFTLGTDNFYFNGDNTLILVTDGEVVRLILVRRHFYRRTENEYFINQFTGQLPSANDYRAVSIVPTLFADKNYIYRANGLYVICYPPERQSRNNSEYWPATVLIIRDLDWFIEWSFE